MLIRFINLPSFPEEWRWSDVDDARRRSAYGFADKFWMKFVFPFGGYAAEEIMFGQHETGVSNDLKQATRRARNMAVRYGMAPEIGPVSFADVEDHSGYESFGVKGISEEYLKKIDAFVEKKQFENVFKNDVTLTSNKETLVAIAEKLLEVETLNREEFEAFFPLRPREISFRKKY